MQFSFERLAKNWESLVKEDALHAILSRPESWEKDEFFTTGLKAVERVNSKIASLHPTLCRDRALDFGCGYGRLTQALCLHFEHVVGVDVAPTMIERANTHNQHKERCTYVLNPREDLSVFPDSSFDFVLSLLVLQHILPGNSITYIREFLRILRPNGIAYFQIPTGRKDGNSNQSSASMNPSQEPKMYMFHVSGDEVVGAIEDSGGHIIHQSEAIGMTDKFHSQLFVAKKS